MRAIVLHHLSLPARCRGMIYLPVFKLPRFVLEFFFFPQAVITLRETKVRSDSRRAKRLRLTKIDLRF